MEMFETKINEIKR